MYSKIFVSLAFLLLCFNAKALVQLECDEDTTPADCKEKFKVEFNKILMPTLIKFLENKGEMYIETIKYATGQGLPKEESDVAIRSIEDLIERGRNLTTPLELRKVLADMAHTENAQENTQYFQFDESFQGRLTKMGDENLTEFAQKLLGPTMDLLNGLRPQDIAAFETWEDFKHLYKFVNEKPHLFDKRLWINLAKFLSIPV